MEMFKQVTAFNAEYFGAGEAVQVDGLNAEGEEFHFKGLVKEFNSSYIVVIDEYSKEYEIYVNEVIGSPSFDEKAGGEYEVLPMRVFCPIDTPKAEGGILNTQSRVKDLAEKIIRKYDGNYTAKVYFSSDPGAKVDASVFLNGETIYILEGEEE